MKKAILTMGLATASLGGCNQAEKPEQTIQQLMADEVQPTAEVYWESVQFISDEQGQHEIFPRTDAEWQRTKVAATKLIELAYMLKTPAYAEGRGEDWIQFSDSLVEVGKLAEEAADAHDRDKVFEVGGTIYSVCSACHQVFPATTEEGQAERPGGVAAENPTAG